MDNWRYLFFNAEYANRDKVLSDLTLEQVTLLPSTVSHSIYDELWHLTKWQRIIAFRDEGAYESWETGELYPTHPSASEQEWHDLVKEFFDGLEQALSWTTSPDKLIFETDPGITMADNLSNLAIHNAYHLGKIVAVRQMLGAWPVDQASPTADSWDAIA